MAVVTGEKAYNNTKHSVETSLISIMMFALVIVELSMLTCWSIGNNGNGRNAG
jgi:hypothetical protein